MWSDPSFCLEKIAEAASDVQTLLEGMTQERFEQLPQRDRIAYRAIKNAIVEVGEAIKALPQELRDRRTEVDWRGLVRLRDVVVHRYPKLDQVLLWPVLANEFPDLLRVAHEELERWAAGGRG
jgi:uncharacterized protein with HEPN domain